MPFNKQDGSFSHSRPAGAQAQEQAHQPTGKMNALLPQIEEAAARQKLSTEGQQRLAMQIRRCESHGPAQQWLTEEFERIEKSPCYMESDFPVGARMIKGLIKLGNHASAYIENTKRSLIDHTIGEHLHHHGNEIDKHLATIEDEKPDTIDHLLMIEKSIKGREASRREYLHEEIKLNKAKIENIEASINDETQTLQANLLRQHKREQIAATRMQSELALLQMPWPTPPVGLSTTSESQRGQNAALKTQPGPSHER